MHTYTTLRGHNNIILIGESGEEDKKEKMMPFTSISPRYFITAHHLGLILGEGSQPSTSLEVVTILLHGLLTHYENGVNTNKNLDAKFSRMKKLKQFLKTRNK